MTPKKKVFITGASGGIGSSICDIFLSKGYELIITSSSSDKLQLLKEKYGENNFYFDLDLSNSKSIIDCMTKISSEHKDISVIINNAGITEDNLILRMKPEQWEKVINTEISDEDLYLLKIKYRGQIAHSLQSVSQRAEHKAHLLGIGLKNDHDKETLIRLKSISSKEIKDAANRYLRKPSLSVCSNKNVLQKIRKKWNNY